MDFSEIVQISKVTDAKTFMKLIEEAVQELRGEEKYSGNFTLTGKLVNLKPEGEALVIGDLHGDLTSLGAILQKSI